MVELQLPKLIAWVRFPSPAPVADGGASDGRAAVVDGACRWRQRPSRPGRHRRCVHGRPCTILPPRQTAATPARVPRMKLAILSRNSKLYSTRRLVEAARERRHSVRVLDPLRCYMRISVEGFDLRYKGRPIAGYNAVIPRIGASTTRYGNAVLHQFELMGSFTPNPSAAIKRARDKLRRHQLLAAQGIGLPVNNRRSDVWGKGGSGTGGPGGSE